jgi:alkanesulfonate monooxygenase SsuD/methylene tetrahydromethanopterin reductase-like flavin-dependent oxidoreductase (luciferase family)
VLIELGVLVLPTRQVAWLGAQIAALQHVSGNRIVLGVGIGGFPDSPFWRAVGGPAKGRGQLVERMLTVLPQLIAGEPITLADGRSRPTVTLAPPAPVPLLLVGGHCDIAIRRAITHGDGWFPSLMSPATLAARVKTLHDLAAAHGRPRPRVHFGRRPRQLRTVRRADARAHRTTRHDLRGSGGCSDHRRPSAGR